LSFVIQDDSIAATAASNLLIAEWHATMSFFLFNVNHSDGFPHQCPNTDLFHLVQWHNYRPCLQCGDPQGREALSSRRKKSCRAASKVTVEMSLLVLSNYTYCLIKLTYCQSLQQLAHLLIADFAAMASAFTDVVIVSIITYQLLRKTFIFKVVSN
jgi:hypothetical protein